LIRAPTDLPPITSTVRRLMQQNNLLSVRRRKFATTTDSRHRVGVCANVAPPPRLQRPDQLYVVDPTYIGLRIEFVGTWT
jgi:hypothetical protein